MVLSQIACYAKVCFQHAVLPKIIRVPSFNKLKDLKRFVRTNAAKTQSELGDGSHDYLGVERDDAFYLGLTCHHFNHPAHAGMLVIATGTAHHEYVHLRDEISKDAHLFCETL